MTALKAHQIAWQKMFVKKFFGGLNPARKPNASTFDNNYKYGEMLVENIIVYSMRAPSITHYRSGTCWLYF
jgi:uncharacterized protein (DUF362 family)